MTAPTGDSYSVSSGGVIAAGRFYISQFWLNLSSGWTELTFTGEPPSANMFAYSGMWLDSSRGECGFIGGGHQDSNYSGVIVADIDSFVFREDFTSYFTSVPTVAQAQAVTDNTNYPGAIMVGGQPRQPISRHTYHSVHYVDGVVTVAGGSTYSGPTDELWYENGGAWLNDPKDFWTYNPTTKAFSYKGSARTNLTNFYGSRSVVNPVTGVLYAFKVDANSHLFPTTINLSTGTITTLSGLDTSATTAAHHAVFEKTGRYCYILATTDLGAAMTMRLLRYDTETSTFSVMPVNGGSLPSFAYDEVYTLAYSDKTGKLYALSKQADGMSVYDPATGVWSVLSLPLLTGLSQTSGRFAYDKKRDAFLLFFGNSSTVKAFAFRE